VSIAVVWELGRGVRAVATESDGLVLQGINADGSVLVGSDGQSRVLRISDGTSELLAEDGAARGTSADGSIVVGYTANQAFRWQSGGELELLEGPDGETQSYALAVNAGGSLIVGTIVTAAGRQAARWNADGEAELLAVPDDATASEAVALSDDGAVIVGTAWVDDEPRAIMWTDAGFEMLQGPEPSNARGVSALGTRIVGVANGEPGVWDGSAEFVSLRELLTEATLDDWLLRDASGVSADGGLLIGNAELTGANAGPGARAFVALLPQAPE
jgi:uncharacterized membrane protein